MNGMTFAHMEQVIGRSIRTEHLVTLLVCETHKATFPALPARLSL